MISMPAAVCNGGMQRWIIDGDGSGWARDGTVIVRQWWRSNGTATARTSP